MSDWKKPIRFSCPHLCPSYPAIPGQPLHKAPVHRALCINGPKSVLCGYCSCPIIKGYNVDNKTLNTHDVTVLKCHTCNEEFVFEAEETK